MLAVYATCTGGTLQRPTFVGATVTGDLTREKIYNAYSTGTTVKGTAIFLIKTGTEGGEVNFTRSVSSGAIM